MREGLYNAKEHSPWYYDVVLQPYTAARYDINDGMCLDNYTSKHHISNHLRILREQYPDKKFSVEKVTVTTEKAEVIPAPLVYDCPLCGLVTDVKRPDEYNVRCKCGTIFPWLLT
jgi:hypothetical protein